jgi:hypothetical protein
MTIFIIAVLAYYIGFHAAHHTIARECRKLGAFYVGKSVFKCTEVVENRHE